MQRLLAITRLTIKAAFRYRLVQVLGLALVGLVTALPLVIKDDGTARGLTQILLTYTLSMTTALLGIATLWLACGTLAQDIEQCHMQVVAVKPIPRWQIWLGKFLGIMVMNAALLALAGVAIYALLQWRAGRLPEAQQTVLRNEVLVARGSLKEEIPDLEPIVQQAFEERMKQSPVAPSDRALAMQQVREQVKFQLQVVPSGYTRTWVIPLGWRKDSLRDQPLFLRVKFVTATPRTSTVGSPPSFQTLWQVGAAESKRVARHQAVLASETFHEFELPPNMFDDEGKLTIEFSNPNEEALLFQIEDGVEVLFRESGFGLNFVRGLAIIFCWLGLLALIGLASASFLSFPVAAFLAFGLMILAFSTGTLSQVVEEGGIAGVNHETGTVAEPGLFDHVVVSFSKGALQLINLARGFSPVDSLSGGRSITWGQVALAVLQILGVMGGFLAAVGMTLFTRRELATAQGSQ